MIASLLSSLRGIGAHVIDGVWRMGVATRFFLMTLLQSGQSFRRFHLIIREIYSSGVLSLIIILVSGCSSAWCSVCRATKPCRPTVPRKPWCLVSLSLVRELGPVVAALLFASGQVPRSPPRSV